MEDKNSETVAQTPSVEDLSPSQDAAIKGGRKQGKDQNEYYNITMNDVLVAGTQPTKTEGSGV